jgi:hypothetical protein
MNKITLLYHPEEHSNFTAVHLEPLWKKYFNLEPVDTNKNYNKQDVVLIGKQWSQNLWYKSWEDSGYRVIIDCFWDNDVFCSNIVTENCLKLKSPNWAWINEALWYKHLKYDHLDLKRSPDKFFLTMMRLKKPHRTMLFDAIKHFQSVSLITYTDQNITISGDCDPSDPLWQRYVNVDWYNSTCFSLVAETITSSPTFMSEKTFKPIAFQHPFLIFGSQGTLDYLHKSNFETFGHMVDESYDLEIDTEIRLEKIMSQVNSLHQQYIIDPYFFCDTETIQKMQHNFNHFYNRDLMTQMFDAEMIEPILNFVESQ